MCRVRRVDDVEVDAAIQDERAIKLATAYEAGSGTYYRIRSLSRFAQCVWTSNILCAVIIPDAATAGTPIPGNVESPHT